MQAEITEKGDLLDHRGQLSVSGWAKSLMLEYDRSAVRASRLRIKEWDYYEIINPVYGIVLLIYDIGYQGRAVVKWMDFSTGTFEEYGATLWFTRGAMGLPASADTGDIMFESGGKRGQCGGERAARRAGSKARVHWECRHVGEGIGRRSGEGGGEKAGRRNETPDSESDSRRGGGRREFVFDFPGFRGGAGLGGSLSLTQPAGQDTMVNAVPFRGRSRFVYVQKINCMVPDGSVRIGDTEYQFSSENSSFGCLDWSRAVFPYHVTWRWCTASGTVGGVPFGLNIDYGFGTESSKSMIFHDGAGHHLDRARYVYDRNNPEAPWYFSDNEDRVDLTLNPVCVERGGTNYLLLKTKVLKAYGFFTGHVVLDDGSRIEVKESDRLFGSAEDVINYW